MNDMNFSPSNAVLVQGISVTELERMIERAVAKRIQQFYESIREQPPVLIRRKVAAERLGVSLPTIDLYARTGFLHPKRLGGRVFFDESELEKYATKNNIKLKIA